MDNSKASGLITRLKQYRRRYSKWRYRNEDTQDEAAWNEDAQDEDSQNGDSQDEDAQDEDSQDEDARDPESAPDTSDPPRHAWGYQIESFVAFEELLRHSRLSASSKALPNIKSPPAQHPSMVKGGEYEYDVSLAGRRSIRLLHVHPSVPGCDQVECSMTVMDLDSPIVFGALSYSWGAKRDTDVILMAGKRFSVSKTIYEALSAMRVEEEWEAWIWIDALCINQADAAERNEQVAMMREIYDLASCVHIWFGPAVAGSADLFRILAHEVYQLDLKWDYTDYQRSEWNIDDSAFDYETIVRARPAVLPLCNVQWWQRLWVVQEAAVAGLRAVVHWGDCRISFSDLKRAISDIGGLDPWSVEWKGLFHGLHPSDLAKVARLRKYSGLHDHAAKLIRGLSSDIVYFLKQVQGLKVSVDHDRIYAILGFLPIKIVPNYCADIREVLQTFFLELYKQLPQDTRLLELGGLDPDSAHDYPSWLPWSSAEVRVESWIPEDCSVLPIGTFSLTLVEPDKLKFSGLRYSTISFCTSSGSSLFIDNANIVNPDSVLHLRSVIKLWWSQFQAHSPSDADLFNVLWVLYGGIRYDTDYVQIHRLNRWLTSDSATHLPRGVEEGALGRLMNAIAARRLFVTENGRVGLADKRVRIGDTVMYPCGSTIPLILRRPVSTLCNGWLLLCCALCNVEFHEGIRGDDPDIDLKLLRALPVEDFVIE